MSHRYLSIKLIILLFDKSALLLSLGTLSVFSICPLMAHWVCHLKSNAATSSLTLLHSWLKV
jgi:hypothetical protein